MAAELSSCSGTSPLKQIKLVCHRDSWAGNDYADFLCLFDGNGYDELPAEGR